MYNCKKLIANEVLFIPSRNKVKVVQFVFEQTVNIKTCTYT